MAALVEAAASGALPRLRQLLGGGVRVDARDSEGRTALMAAAAFDQADAFGLVLEVGGT